MSTPDRRRAVVTGLSVAAPGGLGTERYWKSLLTGENGIAELSRFDASRYPSRLAGQIDDFEASEHLPSRLLPQTDVSTRYALAAADWALADAGVGPESGLDDYDLGVVTSTAQGGFDFTHREFHKLWSQGPAYVSVYESFAWFYAVNTGQISIRNAMRGPSAALVGEQAGGLDAIGHARRTVRRGTRLVLSGGVDSALDPWGFASQLSGGLVSTVADPERAYLPFDVDASGYVPGEGGAVLIVEDADSARARGAERIYGEIAGYAATFDPAPGSGRPPALGRAAELALAEAGLTPADISVVFADGAGVPELDRAEADTLARLFGPRGVPVTAPKALTGRLCAGGGPADLAAALLALRDQVIPATGRTARVPDAYALDLVTGRPREAALSAALVLARGRHGFNSAVVVTAPRL
ncbi:MULTISPECIES: ketosynthase chain-length factor [Streptomyces]|uniref:ketosynthase chain-length factor n=1 Tax=Streptomyces TaxID=1883 RepID=UPI001317C8AF|nr:MULTISPECIES: ketosynthase chain-length factor [Streptomyces]QGZ49861.1 ketosynthase chain-length factor [Streptomyces sp. QHH-9511]QJD07449.1 polyketide ketoacyl synthase chain-length factor/beta-ketoacyl_synthase [Streptomyces sp.]GGT68436.1 actinorhodin polyketide putative beta-ketoacyl synthase 2 [Streptomyces lateritius]